MIDHARLVQAATLEEIQAQFATWRGNPHRARRIPDTLWDAAVSLCEEHSVCKVSRALGVDYNALRSRYRKSGGAQSSRSFVEIAPLWSHPEVVVECDDDNRRQMRIHCKGPVDPRVVDLVKGFFESRR